MMPERAPVEPFFARSRLPAPVAGAVTGPQPRAPERAAVHEEMQPAPHDDAVRLAGRPPADPLPPREAAAHQRAPSAGLAGGRSTLAGPHCRVARGLLPGRGSARPRPGVDRERSEIDLPSFP